MEITECDTVLDKPKKGHIVINKTQQDTKACSIPCNLCGYNNIEELSLKDRNGKYLRTVICKICGLIWTDPRDDRKDIKKFYSKEYRLQYKGICKPKLKRVYRDANEALRRYDFMKGIIKKDDVILDIGSGSGVFLYTLRKLGYDARGIEPDEGYANYAIEVLKVPVKVEFARDFRTSKAFNIITMHHVLEHMENPYAVMHKARSLLKNDGFLIIEVPNAEDIRQAPYHRYHKAHLYTFNPENLECMGRKAGFNVYKTSVAPYNGNIAIIFQKSDTPQIISGKLPGNFEKITNILNEHTTIRHFTTLIPCKKLLKNTIKAIGEQIMIKKFDNGKDIIDSTIKQKGMI
ncbi:MAG: class I SAM-dependent methyltransferase [Planctomycetota bacterium]